MSNSVSTPANQADPILAEHAAVIRRLGRRSRADAIEIGRRLAECRRILKEDGRWRSWLAHELKLSPQSAGRFIQVYEQRSNLEHLDLPVSAIYELAAPSCPATVRTDIAKRAQSGEVIRLPEVKRTIDTAKGRKHPVKQAETAGDLETVTKLAKTKSSDAYAPLKPSHDRAARKLFNLFDQTPGEVQRHFLEVMRDDIPATGTSELVRLQALVDELQNEKRQLEIKAEGPSGEVEELKAKLDETAVRHQRKLFRRMLDSMQKAEVPNILAKEKRSLHNSVITDLAEFVRSAARDGLSVARFDVFCRPETRNEVLAAPLESGDEP